MNLPDNPTPAEVETVAANRLISAAHLWLASLPTPVEATNLALADAAELRFELTLQRGTQFARIAAKTLSADGSELVLLGATDLAPPKPSTVN